MALPQARADLLWALAPRQSPRITPSFELPILGLVLAPGPQPEWDRVTPAGRIAHHQECPVPRTQSVPGTNRLIKALSRKDRQRFLAACEPVDLVFAEILAEPGERIRHVHFPTESFISLLSPTGGSDSLEVGMVGDEGMLGLALMLGVNVSPLHAVVQVADPALRMNAAPRRS